jgi:hypothetical protein
MLNRSTMTSSTCPCGKRLGSDLDPIRDMSRVRVWLWELRHVRHDTYAHPDKYRTPGI